MAIKASGWCESFQISWADDAYQWLSDNGWRLKITEGGVLLFEVKGFPPDAWIAPPYAWKRVRMPSVDLMAIKASDWCDNSYIWLADDQTFSDNEYRMRITDGGMLILQAKTKGLGFLLVAPHAWTRVKTPSVDPLAIKASDWCDNFYVWLADLQAPGFSGYYNTAGVEYRVKMMDGGMLLFQEQTEGGGFGGFVIVAPHAWTGVKAPFDFSKRHRRPRALTALKWHKEAVWWRAGDPDAFGSGTTWRIFGGVGKNDPALDISPANPGGYELWVWSGPAEDSPVLGLMGADLRSQKRAQRLGWYRLLREAKEAADAYYTTGVFR